MHFQRLNNQDVGEMLALQEEYARKTQDRLKFMMQTSESGFRRVFEFQNFAFGFYNERVLHAFITCAIPTSKAALNLGKLHLGYNDEQADKIGEIHVVLVSDGYRGKGVGSHLLSMAINEFRMREVKTLLTTIHPENLQSISIFQKNGFGIVKSIQHHGETRALLLLEIKHDS